jgi:hypothetical protein
MAAADRVVRVATAVLVRPARVAATLPEEPAAWLVSEEPVGPSLRVNKPSVHAPKQAFERPLPKAADRSRLAAMVPRQW